jgi:hypothetical protein
MKTGVKSSARGDGRTASLVYLLVCCAVTAAFVVLVLYPRSRRLADVRRAITRVQREIAEQKVLFPLRGEIAAARRIELPAGLALPEAVDLPRDRIDGIHALLKGLAAKCDLELAGATPGVRSLQGQGRFLRTEIIVLGSFVRFRAFLLEAIALPCLRHIERVHVTKSDDRDQLQLVVWLAIEA